jgi:hypothetical protein
LLIIIIMGGDGIQYLVALSPLLSSSPLRLFETMLRTRGSVAGIPDKNRNEDHQGCEMATTNNLWK